MISRKLGIMAMPFLYAIPCLNSELAQMFMKLHERFDEYCTPFTSRYANIWTPHTTLSGYSPEKVDIAVKMFSEIHGKIIGVKVVDCSTDNTFNVVYRKYFK